MEIKKATFITSVASSKQFYQTEKPLIAVAGKSNVGKSSFINMLARNGKLARTSVTPGRTRLINYFDFGEFVMADLPGYGFAKVSKEEKEKWGRLMEDFLSSQKIALTISLVDIRHEPTTEDKMMINYLYHYALPFCIIATKADKLPKTRIIPAVKDIATAIKVGVGDITPVSSQTGYNKDKVLKIIEDVIKQEKEF